ncbi:DUF6185 family protein [Streptomyces chartreusis]|uniref:DUF6185 family protein n=1 Tax=Streptomyces chartreusis TaxID=1969 RepID=UPI0036CF9730
MSCVLVALAPARAAAAADERCAKSVLADARVTALLRLEHDDRTYSQISTVLSVDVPAGWKRAKDLLLSEDSQAYGTAMACLTRFGPGQQRRWTEWRSNEPVVTSKDGRIKVVAKAHGWVNQYRSYIEVGVWRVRATAALWTVTLQPPPALEGAHWDKITVDPGVVGAESVDPSPTAGEGTSALVWRPEATRKEGEERAGTPEKDVTAEPRNAGPEKADTVTISLRPSWQRSWAAQNTRLIALGIDNIGGLLWILTIGGFLWTAAVLYRKRSTTPTAGQRRTVRNLVEWAAASALLFVLTYADDLMRYYEERHGPGGAWYDGHILRGQLLALAAGVLLFCFARPPWRFWAAGGLLLVPPFATMTRPDWFGLRPRGEVFVASDTALAAQTTASCCVLTLTALGCVAVAWRLADDGDLLPMSRSFPGQKRVLRLRIAGPSAAIWTVVMAWCYALTEERNWQRASWLSDRSMVEYGIGHRANFAWEAVWSVSNGQQLLLNYGWILTSLAVLSVLRAWRAPLSASSGTPSMSPLDDPADRLLFLAFFPVGVGIGGGYHLANSLLTPLWIPLFMLALYGAVTLLASHAVLAQPLEISGRPLATETGLGARVVLLEKSRVYRETHAELRRLDQGLFGDEPPVRKDLERQLDKLHDWSAGTSPAHERLPVRVSVVDAALALGPRDDWWANGVRGARLACLPGVPAAVLGTWADWVRGEAWQDTLGDQLGLPGMALGFLYWLFTWVGAGFVLGALWRALPGRRGAAKALPVALAFSVPVGLDAVSGWFTREGTANLALYASTMLLVLTVTGIALDLDTFQGERRYWQSRLGLLLSVYQMRYYSLQIAYLVAQVIAVISIWQFFAEPAATPPPSSGDK